MGGLLNLIKQRILSVFSQDTKTLKNLSALKKHLHLNGLAACAMGKRIYSQWIIACAKENNMLIDPVAFAI